MTATDHQVASILLSKPPSRTSADWQNEQHDEASVRRAFGRGQHNIGVLLGSRSGNLVDCDQDHPILAAMVDEFLPATGLRFGRASKPGGHRLYQCEPLPKTEKFTDPIPVAQGGMGSIGEIRAEGVQTVLPGSFHEASGEVIVWYADGEPARIAGPELRTAYAEACAFALLRHHFPGEHARHLPALALAGGLLRADWKEAKVIRWLEMLWPSADPGQVQNVVRSTAKKLHQGEKVTGWPTLLEHINPAVVQMVRKWLGINSGSDRPQNTDFGNSERFLAQHGRNARYCPQWGKWLLWDGKRWAEDEKGTVREWGKDTIRAIPDETKEEPDESKRKATLKWAISSEQSGRLESMLRLAQTVEGIAVAPKELDRHPWLLNVANGTLDLQKLELREARREDLLTKVMPVAYLPNTDCPAWKSFVQSAMQDRSGKDQPELVAYLQRLVGYLLTGDITEKILPMLWGPGDTGKTTFTETILALMGSDYGMTTPESTIAAKSRGSDAIPNDVAALRAARLVVVSETTEGLQLNEGRIKAMTGRNQITARFLFQEYFSFVPEFKLLIETNHRPQIKGTDSAIWNRIKPIPWTNVIAKQDQDPSLPDKLRAELPGLLNWALEGLANWQRNGMQEPVLITRASADYREQSDVLGEFLEECCIVEPANAERHVRTSELYRAYSDYITERGQRPLGDQRFAEAMRRRDFEKRTSKGYGRWIGVSLKPVHVTQIWGGATKSPLGTSSTAPPVQQSKQKP